MKNDYVDVEGALISLEIEESKGPCILNAFDLETRTIKEVIVEKGDYIIQLPNGNLMVMSKFEFELSFSKVN